jgi:hypothetical protein
MTYNTDLEKIESINNESWGVDYTIKDSNIDINNISLTSDTIIGVWEKATIGNNINMNGHQLTVIAGGSIELEDGVSLSPNISLEVGFPARCNIEVLPQTASEIHSFCNSEAYDNSFPKKGEILPTLPDLNVTVYPNPFKDKVQIDYSLEESETISIVLYDILGRVLQVIINNEEIDGGEHTTYFDGSNLNSGVYLVEVKSKSLRRTMKLVKQ